MNTQRQFRNHSFSRLVLPALVLAAASLPGRAQSDVAATLPSVAVQAPSVGAHAVCPEFKADMLKALARVAMQSREPGLLDVDFAIDGRRIGDVAIAGGPLDYRRATRRAVRSLDCDNGNAGPQMVRMQVVFKDL